MEEKSFKLTINGEVMLDLKAEGSEEIVKWFTDELTTGCGLFYKMKDQMITIILNHMKLPCPQCSVTKKVILLSHQMQNLNKLTPNADYRRE